MADRNELVEILEKNFEDGKILDAIKKGYSRHQLISLINYVADFHDENLVDVDGSELDWMGFNRFIT